MTVTRLSVKAAKGLPAQQVGQLFLSAAVGAEGDPRGERADRQLSLLSSSAETEMDVMGRPGLCMGRFSANLLIDGAALPTLPAGTRLRIGDAVIELSAIRKKCFPECTLVSSGSPCPLRAGCRFARVVTEGLVRTGDAVIPL